MYSEWEGNLSVRGIKARMGDNSWIVNPGTGRAMERSMQRYRI